MHSISTDLFTVIGLASNIVQFVDSSSDLMELYRSLDGATSSNTVLEAICKDLDKLCTGLVPTADGADGPIGLDLKLAKRALKTPWSRDAPGPILIAWVTRLRGF